MVTGRLVADDPFLCRHHDRAPLNLEPVSPDAVIADLERSPDTYARSTELVQRAAVAPRRRICD